MKPAQFRRAKRCGMCGVTWMRGKGADVKSMNVNRCPRCGADFRVGIGPFFVDMPAKARPK